MRERNRAYKGEKAEPTISLLFFLLDNKTYATPALKIARISNWEKPLNLPGATGEFKKVMVIDSSSIPIFELHKNLGITEPIDKKVALKIQLDDGHIAVTVDQVLTLHNIPQASIKEMDNILSDSTLKGMMESCFVFEDDIIPILDFSSISLK